MSYMIMIAKTIAGYAMPSLKRYKFGSAVMSQAHIAFRPLNFNLHIDRFETAIGIFKFACHQQKQR